MTFSGPETHSLVMLLVSRFFLLLVTSVSGCLAGILCAYFVLWDLLSFVFGCVALLLLSNVLMLCWLF